MKRVVSISLAGRSYKVEEAAYSQLQDYLEGAEKRLKNNPDKEDILNDIEQSIADKCTASLRTGQNVISAVAVSQALEKVGPVDAEKENAQTDKATASPNSPRKLYALPKEGKVAGVCAGLAAYFNVDVTIMRLLFVLLLLITQGFMILIYVVMAIAMPAAKTPEEIAEAHGRPGTAQEIVDKVKQVASDADTVAKIGSVIAFVGKSVALIFIALFSVVFVAATVVWVWLLWAIGLGSLQFSDQLAVLNGWKQVVFVTALYALFTVPLLAFARALNRVLLPEKEQLSSIKTNVANSTITTVIILAAVTVFAFGSIYASRIHDYVNSHDGYLYLGEYTICVDENKCSNKSLHEFERPHLLDENGKPSRG